MRVQLIHGFDGMKECGVYLWQIFTVKEIQIRQIGRKYPSVCKYYICQISSETSKEIKFYYNEVKEL